MVCAECTTGMEIFSGTPDGTSRWHWQVEACFGPFGDSVSLSARKVHGLRRTYHRYGNHFGCNRWYSYVTWVKWNLVTVHLEIVLISMPCRCTVCTKRTIGSEIFLDAPDCTPRWRGSNERLILTCLEIVLISAQDRCTVCAECTTGMEITLGTPDGTPM
jgi:hypothetical protein